MTSIDHPISPSRHGCRCQDHTENLSLSPPSVTTPLHDFRRKNLKKIRLNIGGKVFATTVETLTRVQPSFFASMFSGVYNTEPDEDGEFFIDRSYKHFDRILNYLRTDQIFLPESEVQLRELLLESEYYGLQPLVDVIAEKLGIVTGTSRPQVRWSNDVHLRAGSISITEDGIKASGKGCVLSHPITRGRHFVEITLDDMNGNCNRVGLITHIPFRLNAAPREGYLYCPACGTGYGKLHHRFKGKKLQTGDRFGIGIDMDRSLLHFFKNEEHMGSISTRLPKEVWVIAYLNDNCSEVSLEAKDFPMLPTQLIQIAPQQASALLDGDSPVEDEEL